MDRMPLSVVIFQAIPESMLLFSFGVAIVGEYINLKRVLIASIISAVASILIRNHVPFGLHSIIGILVLFILFWKLLNLKPWKAIISSLISLMVLILLETTILQIILKAQNLTLKEFLKDNFKRITNPYSYLVIFGLITWLLYSKKISIIRGSRVGNDDKHNNARLLVTIIILFQGICLAIVNQHLDYFGQYSLLIKMLYIIFFISSILFLNHLYGGDGLKKAQYRDKT